MVIVSPELFKTHLTTPRISKMFTLLDRDVEVQTSLEMSNVMAVKRLVYNDHGVVHARIVVGSALELFDRLSAEVEPSLIRNGVGDLEDSQIVVLCGAYLHDVGNAIHRTLHHVHGVALANPILTRLLPQVYEDRERLLRVKHEILHSVFSHDDEVRCLSVEAGISKVADGTDMAEGRARIPYRTGKVDIHSLSALAIDSLEIRRGEKRPVSIVVTMKNPAGIFQIEEVLERKILSSGLEDFIEVVALQEGRELKTFRWGHDA
jgi:metal-dependent HD superfamily phosphatase/phosphodiesterase